MARARAARREGSECLVDNTRFPASRPHHLSRPQPLPEALGAEPELPREPCESPCPLPRCLLPYPRFLVSPPKQVSAPRLCLRASFWERLSAGGPHPGSTRGVTEGLLNRLRPQDFWPQARPQDATHKVLVLVIRGLKDSQRRSWVARESPAPTPGSGPGALPWDGSDHGQEALGPRPRLLQPQPPSPP